MPLTLSLSGQGPQGPVRDVRSLDRGQITLGRGSDCDWVLPDSDGQISRSHCSVALVGSAYVLTDFSTNGVYLNGAPDRVPRGSQVPLASGDEVRIGPYTLRVSEDGPAAAAFAPAKHAAPDPLDIDPFGDLDSPAPAAGFRHPPRIETPMPRGLDPFDAAEQSRAADDIDRFQGKAADPSWSGAAQRDDVDALNQYYRPPKAVGPKAMSDADFDDLLGDLPLGPGAAPVAPAAAPMAPPAATPNAAADIDFDDLLGDLPLAATPAPPVAPPVAVAPAAVPPAPPPVVVASPDSANPFDEPDLPARPPVAAPVALPPPASVPAVAPASRAAGAGDAQRLLAAFLEGAGNPRVDLAAEDPEAYFRLMGQLMRIMVENLREVLMSRAEVKRAFGIEQTMLQARNNNALKFSVTPEDAVAAILQPSRPGYLPPRKATEEAFKDLAAHQLAVMAGVQASLQTLLKRFDPAGMEARMAAGGLGSFLPGSYKSRAWDAFCATYADIAREAEEDFQAVFGRGFARAYQTQEREV